MDHPAARWRAAAASWHAIGSGSVKLFFLWQQDLGDCAFVTTRSTVSRVCSGGRVLDAWSDQPPGSLGRSPGTRDQSPVGLGLRLHLDECRSFSPESSFAALVSEVARRVGVEPRALAVRALLHLPRTASYKGWVSRWQVDRELRINAERLRHDLRAARGYVPVTAIRAARSGLRGSRLVPRPSGPNAAPLSSERSSGLSPLRPGRSGPQTSRNTL